MKKIILSVAVVATAAIAGWNYQQNQQSVELSDLAMENVEALATGEVIVGPWYCAGSGYCFETETGTLWTGVKYYFP